MNQRVKASPVEQPQIPPYNTLIDALRHHVELAAKKTLFTCIDSNGHRSTLTIEELDVQAKKIGAALINRYPKGTRILLPTQNDLSFHVAFLGCLYAGCIAVPVQTPRLIPKRADLGLGRFLNVAQDAQAPLVLLDEDSLEKIKSFQKVVTNQCPALAIESVQSLLNSNNEYSALFPEIDPMDTAFIQYTSGSTSRPKGVVITHGAIVANQKSMQRRYFFTKNTTSVSWLPLYHDMGLTSGLFMPIFMQMNCVILSPLAFIAKPEVWLTEIGRHQDVVSGGPNFAFAHCLARVHDSVIPHLDLSRWRVAFCGAEPIRPQMIKTFVNRFSRVGFSMEAFYPSYGLAEGTLFVSAKNGRQLPTTHYFNQQKLRQSKVEPCQPGDKQAIELMGCGAEEEDIRIVIVDPDTLKPLKPGQVGEILVSSPGAGLEYWRQRAASTHTFNIKLEGESERRFFRTGDLGFKFENQLYIAGRVKELIIHHGVNHYPHDIEHNVQSIDKSLATLKSAFFALPDTQRYVLVQEVNVNKLTIPLETLEKDIRSTIWLVHQLPVYDVILVKPGVIARTTSGKVQRLRCAKLYEKGFFKDNQCNDRLNKEEVSA